MSRRIVPLPNTSYFALGTAFGIGLILGSGALLLGLHWRGVDLHAKHKTHAFIPEVKFRSREASPELKEANLPAATRNQLTAVRDLYFAEEKLTALTALAAQAAPGDIPGLLDAAANDPLLSGARVGFLKTLLARWSKTDPSAALDWARQHVVSSERTELATAVLQEWATREPKAAADQAAKEGMFSRASLLHTVMESWARTNPTEAQRWIKTLPPSPLQTEVQLQFLRSLVDSDPVSAADYAIQTPEAGAIEDIVSLWASNDAVAAVAWASGLPKGPGRETALRTMAGQWAQLDLPSVMQYVQTMPDSGQRATFVDAVAESLAARNPQSALSWAQTLPDVSDRARAFNITIARWAERSPAAAAQALASAPAELEAHGSANAVVELWAAQDPTAAAQWTASLSDNSLRANAAETLASQWAVVDPQALQAWWRDLPAGTLRDAVIATGAARLSSSHPSLAADWATSIVDPDSQRQQLESAISRWKEIDTEAVRAWLSRAQIGADLRATLINDLIGKS